MNKQLHLIFLVVLFCSALRMSGQCPTATIPDTVCAGEPFDIINTTPGFESYFWDFCTGDLNNPPAGINIGNPGNLFTTPHQIHIIEDSGNFYGFVANFGSNNIIRLDYGNSPGNTPMAFPLTVSSLDGPTGLQMYKEGLNWYAVVQNYWTSQLVLVDFGTSIVNTTPNVTILGTFGLNSPFHLKLIKENNLIYLFSANFNSSNILKLEFGNSINNMPVSSIISDPSINGPFGIDLIYDCELNSYHGVVSNQNSSAITILNFGNSLQNTPTISSINPPPLILATSVNIIRDEYNWHVFITDQAGNLLQLNFGTDLLNNNPTVIFNGPIGSLSTPRGMEFINYNSIWYGNIINWGGSLSQINYSDTCSVMPEYSVLANPVGISINQPGTYNILLKSINADDLIYHFSKIITVLDAPVSYFNVTQIPCNNSIIFNDSSYTSTGTITSWFWDFGDSTTSTQQNPVHTYILPGNYNVTLTVTTSFGCIDTYNTIVTNNQPVASFSVIDGCVVPPIQFINASPDPQSLITSWYWDFGDGNTSTLENPFHIYSNPGSYNVYLVALIGSCSDTAYSAITYQPKPDIQFMVNNTCLNEQQQFNNFTTIASGSIISYNWDFGDGNFSTLINPIHQYADTGNYSITLIAEASNGCIDTSVQLIRVSLKPTADFIFTPINICSGSNVSFQDNSVILGDTISQWLWNLGNGDTSDVANPNYIFNTDGQFLVTLSVTTGTDCVDSSSQLLTVNPSPDVNFTASTICFGNPTQFIDLTTTSIGNLISWNWNFGNNDTSLLQNPTYQFPNAGNFDVTLSVSSDLGCTASETNSITVAPLPVVEFTVQDTCSAKFTQFTDLSTVDVGFISSWLWKFGDPGSGINNSSTDPNPEHNYNLQGNYLVDLIAYTNNGCVDSISKNITIARTPYANFSSSPTCDGEHVSFTYLDNAFPSNATNWFWNFGNGAVSTIDDPATLYLTWGTYNVTLIVADSLSGCSDTITKPVEVDPLPVAVIPDLVPCKGIPFTFIDSSLINAGSITGWEWEINSITYDTPNPVIIFPDTGSYLISLLVISDKGCKDSTVKVINISGLPFPDFSFFPAFGDAPLNVNFINNSSGSINYIWNFGDGGMSNLINPAHIFTDTGTYIINLTAINNFGCMDSISKSIYVIQPRIDVAVTTLHPIINNNFISLSAEIFNFGTREINNFTVSARLGGEPAIQEYWTGTLKSGESFIYNFNASLEVIDELNFLCVKADNPNGETDNNPSNNQRCVSFSETFEILSVYPNPTVDQFTIQFNMIQSEIVFIELVDAKGSLVRNLFSGKIEKGFNSLTFSAASASLSNGIYNIKITTSEKTVISKLSLH